MKQLSCKTFFSSKLKRFYAVFVLFFITTAFLSAENIRMHLWAQLDAYPELEEAQDINAGVFDFPIKTMKQVAPFLVSGMVYGWKFTYTPSDKARGVKEFFELEEVQNFEQLAKKITYEDPWISEEENRLNCWVNFERDSFQERNFMLWSSIQNPSFGGRGYGSIEKGFEGIIDASKDAVKNGIREYYRNEIRNKPKEISGMVIIRKNPVLGVISGKYVINLDFFMDSVTIIPYSVF